MEHPNLVSLRDENESPSPFGHHEEADVCEAVFALNVQSVAEDVNVCSTVVPA